MNDLFAQAVSFDYLSSLYKLNLISAKTQKKCVNKTRSVPVYAILYEGGQQTKVILSKG